MTSSTGLNIEITISACFVSKCFISYMVDGQELRTFTAILRHYVISREFLVTFPRGDFLQRLHALTIRNAFVRDSDFFGYQEQIKNEPRLDFRKP